MHTIYADNCYIWEENLLKSFNMHHKRDGVDFSINRLTLAFRDRNLENRFKKSYFEINLQVGRACHLIAIFFYLMVGMWDAVVIDPAHFYIWVRVISAVALIFLAGLASSYLVPNCYARFWQPLFAFYVLVTGVGFTLVTLLSGPDYPVYNFVGIIFCLFFCYSFIRLRFVWAAAAGNTIMVFYIMGIWLIIGPAPRLLLSEFFYLFGINLLGMMMCYTLEFMSRRDFMLNDLLKAEENKTKRINARLEQMVEERTRKLRLSEETFAGFFNQGNIGMAITSWKKGWVNVNKKLCKMLGYSQDELSEKTWQEMTHPDDFEADMVIIKKMASNEIDNYEIEKRFIKKDKSIIFVHMTVSCIRHDDGSIDKVLATLQDITKRKTAEHQLKIAQIKLMESEKLSALGTLSAGVAHELNNPLMGILNYSQYVLKKLPADNKLHGLMADAERATQDCIKIVRNLLAFSHSDAADQEIFQEVDVREMLKRILGLLSYRIEKEGISVITDVKDEFSMIHARAGKVQQVLLNLMVNAMDAMKEAKNKKIRITLRPGNGRALITVHDTGYGISQEDLGKIFDPFFTTKPVGKGTGLGLSVSYGIIKDHKGEISCSSKPNEGTCFTISLPMRS